MSEEEEFIPYKSERKLANLFRITPELQQNKVLQDKIVSLIKETLQEARQEWNDIRNDILNAIIICDRKQEAFKRGQARDINYANKYNFSKYLHISSEKNKRFGAYIEVFKRTQIEDLYDLLAEYKKNVSKQEQMLAAEILHKLLVGDIKEKKAVTPTKNKIDSYSEDIQF